MKRNICLVLVLALACGLFAGCGNQKSAATAPAETTQTAAETAQPTQAPTAPAEVFANIEITADWTIVHDGSVDAARVANELRGSFTKVVGKTMETKNAADTEASSVGEIVIGDCRDPQQWTLNSLCEPYDFAVKVRENALILCANNALAYKYLVLYLKQEVLTKAADGKLCLSSDDNMQYTTSQLQDTGYVEYLKNSGGMIDLAAIFDYRTFQNGDTVLPYRIYVPFNYKPDGKYPLLVNLHGAGLRGNDNVKHLSFIQNVMNMEGVGADQAIIIFPQCPEGQQWVDTDWTLGSYSIDKVPESNELKAVMELISQLQQEFSVDENRIYACGFSMGGYGTWDLLLRHPDVFAAGVPMCGAGDPSKAEILKTTPAWAIHGAKDPTVPVTGSQDMAAAMESVGAENCHYTELPTHEHDVWNYTYTNWEIFIWLFSQSKA